MPFDPSYQYFPHTVHVDPLELIQKRNKIKELLENSSPLTPEQLKNIAAITANIKLDGLRPDLSENILKKKDEYNERYKKRLSYYDDGVKPKTGKYNYTLTAKQQIDNQSDMMDLHDDIAFMKSFGNMLSVAELEAYNMVSGSNKDFTLTPENYRLWDEKLKKSAINGEKPDPRTMLYQFATKKENNPTLKQTEIALYDKPSADLSGITRANNKREPTLQDAKDYINNAYPEGKVWGERRKELLNNGIINPETTDAEAREIDAKMLQKRSFGKSPSEGTTNIYAGGGFDPKFKPKYRILPEKEMQFNAGMNNGLITTSKAKGEGTIGLEPGDLFVPSKTVTKNGVKYITGVKVEKNKIESASKNADGSFSYTMKGGGAPTPVTIPLDAIKDEIESNYFNFNKEGEPDLGAWDKIGYKPGKAPTTNTGKKYQYNGKEYSYDDIIGAGIDLKAAIKSGDIKLK